MQVTDSDTQMLRANSRRWALLLAPAVALLTFSGCTCNDAAPPAAPPAVEAPPPAPEPEPDARRDRRGSKADREGKREQRRAERREQRRLDFDSQTPVFVYPVAVTSPDAEKVRAQILSTVQPVAGVPLRWTLRSCASETVWDTAEGSLKGQGAVLSTETSLDSKTCTAGERSRSNLTVQHATTDAAAAKATHARLIALGSADSQLKVTVESATTAPETNPTIIVQSTERARGAVDSVDVSKGLAKAFTERFSTADSPLQLAAVCGKAQTVREWVLEEEAAMPAKESKTAKTGKNGRERKARERHRSWARLTVTSGASASNAMVHMRGASKREKDEARLQLPQTTYTGLKTAGMVVELPVVDARYRCGG